MFTITQRQYEIIMHQAQACFPEESGGFLGGREDVILGVLPVPNMILSSRKTSFGMTTDDFIRASEFFEKNKLTFYGIYHSHPSGTPYPSQQDLSHNQRYLFIVGLSNRYEPQLYAWEIVNHEPQQVPVRIVDEKLVEQMYLSPDHPSLADVAPADEMVKLASMIREIINGTISYPKNAPTWDSSSFSTTA